jgi:PAS domain S-box-containing protein
MNRDPAAAAITPEARAGAARADSRLPSEFDGLGRLATSVCQARFASIVLIGWGQAWCGSDEAPAPQALPKQDPFFESTSRAAAVFEVPNTTLDKRFCFADCVKGALAVRSYAGCALRTGTGELLGVLAVYGAAARVLSAKQRATLLMLAQQCVAQAELRARVTELERLSVAQGAPTQTAAHVASTGPAFVQGLIESVPVAIYHTDAQGNVGYVNPEYRRIFGLSPEQTPDDWSLGVHPDDRNRMEMARADFWRQPRPMRFEYRAQPKNGTVRYFAEQVVAQPDGSGFVGTINDVSDQLMIASRHAGVAEIATNVLHNVGNMLNSVNTSASLLAERVRRSKAPGISRLAALLQEQGQRAGQFIGEDERGKRIPEYLTALGEQLLTDQRATLNELALLRDNLEHINTAVATQQNYAKLCGVTETVAVIDLVEDSLRLNMGAFARHGVELKREFEDAPALNIDRHKALQILVNLIRNAKYACDESGRSDKLITLRIQNGAHSVRISVIDNGVGIRAENMRHLFSHGFTTRRSDHGFGLHSGALAAQELGGTLRAESDGPGHGSTFVLELPHSPLND